MVEKDLVEEDASRRSIGWILHGGGILVDPQTVIADPLAPRTAALTPSFDGTPVAKCRRTTATGHRCLG